MARRTKAEIEESFPIDENDARVSVNRRDPGYNRRNYNQRTWRKTVNRSYTLSRRLIERVAERNHLTHREAEKIVNMVAEEHYRMFISGFAVALPKGPIVYTTREWMTMEGGYAKGKRVQYFRAHIRINRRMKEDFKKYAVSRGSHEMQFLKERCRLAGIDFTRMKINRNRKGRESLLRGFEIIKESDDGSGKETRLVGRGQQRFGSS